MDTIVKYHDYFYEELSDHRLANYPLMSSPWQLLGIVLLYLYGIYFYLPAHMEGRKPYNLNKIIRIYNLFQVIACMAIMYVFSTCGWTTNFTIGCKQLSTNEKTAVREANCHWWVLILKMVELSETVMFVLRKKYNQVSALHVYHHVSTVYLSWLTCKMHPGGMFTPPVMLNCFIHVLMYTYYFLASFGPEAQKKLLFIKSKLTTLQLIQLALVFLFLMQPFLFSKCQTSKFVSVVGLIDMIILIAFFTDFYVRQYIRKKTA